MEAILVSEKDGRRVTVGSSVIIGRNPDCDLVLQEPSASRRHLEVFQRAGQFQWKDLGSSNGTLLNGQQSAGSELHDGDLLQIGDASLRFQLVPLPPPRKKEDSKLFQQTLLDPNAAPPPASPAAERSTELLEAVYAVANEIATNYDPCRLMDRILEATLPAIDGQRGILMLAERVLPGSPGLAPSSLGEEQVSLVPCSVCSKVHRIDHGKLAPLDAAEVRMSSTAVRRVLENGESVLYKDAAPDREIDSATSVMALNLRSIICVPLRAKHGILGILYIDSDRPDKLYSHEDMLLAAAVGNTAGIALENAQMHQQILEKQRIEQEIQTAWTIQEGFLVKDWPQYEPRFQVYGETRPAKTVGGDFYDFVQPAPGVIGIMIGDVSGKGVPAALTMAQLIAQFRLHARETKSPAEVVRRLNEALGKQSRRGMFCSLCYVMIDLRTGGMLCANAGHPPAVRINADGANLFGSASGPPLGILPEGAWQDEGGTLLPGETVLLYTDGIVEARSTVTLSVPGTAPPEYGQEGLYWKCVELADQPPQAVLHAVQEDVLQFTAPLRPHDDCTMIAARYLGP